MSGFLIEEQKLEIRTFDNSIRFNSWMRLKSKTAKTEKDQNSIRLNFSNKSIKIEKIFVNKTFLNNKNDYKILNNKKILAKTQLQNFAEVQKAFTKILEKRKEGNLLINIPKSDCNLAQIELDIVYSINLAKCKNDVGLKVEPKPNFQILSYNSNWIPKIENEKSMKKFCLNFSCDDENIVVFNGEKTAQKRKAKKMTNFSFSSNFNNNFDYNKIMFVCGDFEQYFFVHEKTEFLFVYPKNKSINPESFKFVKRAIAVYEDFLCTEYPFDRQYFCFVDKSVNPITNCHKLIVLDSKYLYSEKDIDLVFSSRKNIALAIAKNWCQKIFPPSSDQWISLALSEYLRSLFIADEFGPNFCEYRKFSSRFDWKNDYVHHSLSNSNKTKLSNFDKNLEKRIRKKGFLILSLIEIIIGKTEFKSFFKGLALSNEIVKTEKFEQNLMSKVPSRQIKDVFDNYIYNNNVPVYMVDISFDSRKRVVGLKMENVSKNVLQKDFSFSKTLAKPVVVFEENQLGIRRITLSKLDKSIAISNSPISNFRIQCGGSVQKNVDGENFTALKWLRLDPRYEWIFLAKQKFGDLVTIVKLLEPTNDIKANCEAISALANIQQNSPFALQAIQLLLQVLKSDDYFYKCRVLAARTIILMGKNDDDIFNKNVKIVVAFYREKFFEKEKILKRNDFSDFETYFVRKKIDKVLAESTDSMNCNAVVAVKLLIEILEFNDNSNNKYKDDDYISHLIKCCSLLKIQFDEDMKKRLLKQLLRYIKIDQIFPSKNKKISCSSIKAIAVLDKNLQLPNRTQIDFMSLFIKYKSDFYMKIAIIEAMTELLVKDSKKQIDNIIKIYLKIEPSNSVKQKMIEKMRKVVKKTKNNYVTEKLNISLSKNESGFETLNDMAKTENQFFRKFLVRQITNSCNGQLQRCAFDIFRDIYN